MELTISDLDKTYPNGVQALKNVSLTIPRGMFGLFGPDGKNQYGMTEKKLLYLQKQWLTPGRHDIRITLDEMPVKAGIDPYNKLIDRISDDNILNLDTE